MCVVCRGYITCVCVCAQSEAATQQDHVGLFQGGGHPPLLSRRQSLETQYLTHRLQVHTHTQLQVHTHTQARRTTQYYELANRTVCFVSRHADRALSPWHVHQMFSASMFVNICWLFMRGGVTPPPPPCVRRPASWPTVPPAVSSSARRRPAVWSSSCRSTGESKQVHLCHILCCIR